jgi:hypothetical protein
MKRLFVQIISIQCLPILLMSCNFKGNTVDNKVKSCDTLITENYDTFLNKFYSDSIFQISRIIFPLISETGTEIEKKINEEKDPNAEVDTTKFIPHDKNNWIMLSDNVFNNDSVAIIDGVKYKRRFYKTDKFIEERILYADPEQEMVFMKFQLINKKWYMVDFQDGFADE